MEQHEIWSKLTAVFRDAFDDDALALRPETTAEDVEGWDSLRHIQLLVAVEKAFGMRFNTGEVANLANVGQMVELIAKRRTDR
jgi:acyl carrier protein